MRAMVAGLLAVGDLRDLHGYNGPSLDLLHREAGTKGRLHLGCQAAEILLQLTWVAHAHGLEARVLIQAEKQYSTAWAGWRRRIGACIGLQGCRCGRPWPPHPLAPHGGGAGRRCGEGFLRDPCRCLLSCCLFIRLWPGSALSGHSKEDIKLPL